MKCHWCKKDLEFIPDEESYLELDPPPDYFLIKEEYEKDKEYKIDVYECPDYHCTISIENNRIAYYELYFDIGNDRFKIESWSFDEIKDIGEEYFQTTLYKRVDHKSLKRYTEHSLKNIWSINKFIPLQVKDDVIQGDLLFNKIKKYVIFS